MKKPLQIVISLILLIGCLSSFCVSAESYSGYTYDNNKSVASQIGYSVKCIVDISATLPEDNSYEEDASAHSDMFVTDDGYIYITDKGNNQIVILNPDYSLYKVFKTFTFADGSETVLNGAEGIYVNSKKEMYIADTENCRVLHTDSNGKVLQEILYDSTASTLKDMDFRPTAVVVSEKTGFIYVLSEGFYEGALVFEENGKFNGFFGSNTVQVTAELIADNLWKNIFSQETSSFLSKYVPDEFSNMDIDDDGFIYTSSYAISADTDLVKKLNSSGANILFAPVEGEQETVYVNGKYIKSQFSDIYMSEKYLNVLDSNSGRIFQYDEKSDFLFSFGGLGQYEGTFSTPVAIDGYNDLVYVLDSETSCITVFEPTEFGLLVHEALDLYLDGMYVEATAKWSEVLKMDSHYPLAYMGITKGYIAEEKYEEALFYAEKCGNKTDYDYAFQQVRFASLEKAFVYIFIGVILLIVVIFIYMQYRKAHPKKKIEKEKYFGWGLFSRPMGTFEEMRYHNAYRWKPTFIIVAVWFLVEIFSREQTSFLFSGVGGGSIVAQFLGTVVLFVAFVATNWLVSALTDGKGKLKEISTVCAYAIIPYIIVKFISVPLSHFLITSEWAYVNLLLIIAIMWSVYILLAGFMAIHEYSLSKTFLSIFFTVFGICIEIFIILLAFALCQQTYTFFKTVFTEVTYRFN